MTVALTNQGVLTHAVGSNGRTACGRKIRTTFTHASVESATCQTCNHGDWQQTYTVTQTAHKRRARTWTVR